ncbi:MAG: hypothetical protein ABSH53_18200 [Holophaga sp.]
MHHLGYFHGFDLVVVLEIQRLDEGPLHRADKRLSGIIRIKMINDRLGFFVPESEFHLLFLSADGIF